MAAKKTEKAAAPAVEKVESLFSKDQLLSSKRFEGRKDILNALLSPDQQYTISAAKQMVEDYMKGKVE